jgi:hypothetical protein
MKLFAGTANPDLAAGVAVIVRLRTRSGERVPDLPRQGPAPRQTPDRDRDGHA